MHFTNTGKERHCFSIEDKNQWLWKIEMYYFHQHNTDNSLQIKLAVREPQSLGSGLWYPLVCSLLTEATWVWGKKGFLIHLGYHSVLWGDGIQTKVTPSGCFPFTAVTAGLISWVPPLGEQHSVAAHHRRTHCLSPLAQGASGEWSWGRKSGWVSGPPPASSTVKNIAWGPVWVLASSYMMPWAYCRKQMKKYE